MRILDLHPIVLIGLAIVVYMLPTVVASTRWHKNAGPIMLVNLFLGWTVLGWFVALIWATTSHVDEEGQAAALEKKRKRGPVWQRISGVGPADPHAELLRHLAAHDAPAQAEGAAVLGSVRPQAATVVDQLTKLADLRERGHLTDEEFEHQKARLLATV